jgi:hypothetical protein
VIKIEMLISNDGARAAQAEIRSFLAHANKKMVGELPEDFLEPGEANSGVYDKKGTATLGYVVLREFLGLVSVEVARQDREEADARRQRTLERAPTVKAKWRDV